VSVVLIGLLVVAGPVLLLPDVLPASVRVPGIVLASAVAAVASLAAIRGTLRLALAAFILCVAFGWWQATSPTALRHGAGVALGMLTMAATLSWSRTEGRLRLASAAFLLLGVAAMAVGITGIESHPPKFLPITTSWLPQVKFGLSGLDARGFVNPNALAGTAILIVPVALALAFWRGTGGALPRLSLRAMAGVTALVAVLAIVLAQSRSAWLAVLVMLVVAALALPRWRTITLVAGAFLVVGAAVAYAWPLTPEERLVRAQTVGSSLTGRLDIWRQGIGLLGRAPLLGIGLNQFTAAVEVPVTVPPTRHAHAHNFFLQTALDTGLLGLAAYLGVLIMTLRAAARTWRVSSGAAARLAGGGALALVGVHAFGLMDAIALGAKVGVFQWFAMGLVLGAERLAPSTTGAGHGAP
jgi:putative inorganic carbon (HCO3(-)) transporter